MKITCDFVISSITSGQYEDRPMKVITINGTAQREEVTEGYCTISGTEDSLQFLGLQNFDKKIGMTLSCEFTSEPMPELRSKDPYVLFIYSRTKNEYFLAPDDKTSSHELITSYSLQMITGGPIYEADKNQSMKYLSIIIDLRLSAEEYEEIEKLEIKKTAFRISVQANSPKTGTQ